MHPYRDPSSLPPRKKPGLWPRARCRVGVHDWIVVPPFYRDRIFAQCRTCLARTNTWRSLSIAMHVDLIIQHERLAPKDCPLYPETRHKPVEPTLWNLVRGLWR